MDNSPLPAVFTEMLRSFSALGRSLNLSQSVEELQSARQTIRRHINELETLKGGKLFDVKNRQYTLTELGKQSLATAESLLARSSAWISDDRSFPQELAHATLEIDERRWLHMQQQPLYKLWAMAPPLLKRGLKDWTAAEGQLDHEALEVIRPYIMVYRTLEDKWICVEVGEKSSYLSWFGRKFARSSIGRHFQRDKIYAPIDEYLIGAYSTAVETGSHWYDHVCTSVPRVDGGEPETVNYQRLVSACTFPDGEPAALVLIARTDNITIPGMPEHHYFKSKPEELMEFEI